ncbi:alpha-1B adrenergic receptor-like [Bolinopsis microptera]|uniref:alpha-1B adrenergic receptor-like n=1 Tax=Bolinopsis microptera TaxID=2820187 RepID=UPI00307A934D
MATIFDANFPNMTDSLDQEVDRSLFVSIFLCILYLAMMIFTIISNGSVIISAIFERWKEVDNFTFVMFVSLAFNQLFIGFTIFPLMSYSMVAKRWGLGVLFCWWCALLSTYLYTVYIVHAVVLMFDIVIVRYSDLRTTISVSVSKRIAQNIWIICAIPQVYPILYLDHPYLYDPIRGGCYQTFLFYDTKMFFKTFGMFLILPIILISITYFVLLVKEENHRRLTATILKKQSGLAKDLTITRNYITPCLAIIAVLLTILPFFVVGLLKIRSVYIPRPAAEFANTWICLGGCLLPTLYFLVVKTYRLCLYPGCKWDVHVAAITKLRRKTHSPCVRRQGVVMFNVPMMAITEEGEPDSQMSPRSTLSVNSCLDNHLPLCADNNATHGNGSLIPNQYQIKSLRRELPQVPGKKTSNFLTVKDPLEMDNSCSV